MKRFKKALEKPWLAYTFALCTAVVLYLLLTNFYSFGSWFHNLFKLLGPLVAGAVIAYVVNPIVNIFEFHIFRKIKKRMTCHILSVVAAVILVLASIICLMVALIPSLIHSITGLISNTDTYILAVDKLLANLREYPWAADWNITNITDIVNNLLNKVFNYLSSNIGTVLSTSAHVGAAVVNIIIATILAVYFLLSKYGILQAFRRLGKAAFTIEAYKRYSTFLHRCHNILVRYVSFDLFDALIVGGVNAIIMACCKMPHIALISVIVAIANLVPTFGPIAGGVIGTIILLLNKPVLGLIFALYTLVLQTIDGYIFKPRLYGDTMGVPSVWILVAIIAGGNLFGVWGILLSIPFCSVAAILYSEILIPWLKEQKRKRVLARAEDTAPPDTESPPEAASWTYEAACSDDTDINPFTDEADAQ